MRRSIWLAGGLMVCAGLASNVDVGGSSSEQAPGVVDPGTAPAGGEPGIVAGPPNPGYGKACGQPPDPAAVRGTVHVLEVPDSKRINPCR